MTGTVLLTRPQAQSDRFAAALRARFGAGLAVVIAPVLRIVPRGPLPVLAVTDTLIFTSENGVAAYAALGGAPGRQAFCVGPRTAEAAAAAGLAPETGPGDAAALARAVAAAAPGGRVWHLHGVHVTGDLAGDLRARGLDAEGAAIYDQIATGLPGAARWLLADRAPVAVPVFSARTAQLLAPELAAARAPLRLAAMSPAVAEALPRPSGAAIEVAARPDAEAMVAALAQLGVGAGDFLRETPAPSKVARGDSEGTGS